MENARKEVQSRGKLDEKTRAQILKERQRQKKSRRQSMFPQSDDAVSTDTEQPAADNN